MDIGLLPQLLLVGSRGVHVAERYETLDLGSRHTRLRGSGGSLRLYDGLLQAARRGCRVDRFGSLRQRSLRFMKV